ncbi:phage protein [Capnocytophaga stomatis]|uniref:YopX family protein n=1 Tax=Capnocytophaga stomatis TaxID=1848904 RepID=UPI00194FA2B0|nr:YopX family protein [Capnocytophaga stomatis]GIJ96595.1 phage protein [Capnocytophaga stomatis]
MQREIKFRGKDIKNNWHYGLLAHNKRKDKHYEWFISNSVGEAYAYGVIKETIGQFTGLYDKNGKDIFEGDILDTSDGYAVVEHSPYDGGWDVKFSDGGIIGISEIIKSLVVAGNIYENPELLK